MAEYDFEIDRIISEIKKQNPSVVGLQFPEGLKSHAVEIARELEGKSGVKAVIFTDPIYGACDTKDADAKRLGLDLVVHFGHTDLL